MGIYLRTGVFLWVLLQGGIAIGGETAKEIERLLDAGAAGPAYQLGLDRSAKEAGDPEFDFWFALAAIQVGHPEQALFALERILLLFPENDRVRLELARAHFLLANYPEARTQFELVLTQKPPKNVRARVKLFLEKIAEQERAVRPSYHAYTNITSGHDSNINSATSETAVVVPALAALGPVTLTEESRELDDNFLELEIGGDLLRPISKKKAWFGAVSLNTRSNVDTDEFDTDTLGLRGGISFLGRRSVIRVPLQVEQLNLDGESFRRLLISGTEWERPFKRAERIAVFGQLGAIEYPDQDFRDVTLVLVGTVWTHQFGQANRRVKAGIYVGDEDADDDEPPVFKEHNGRDYVGVFGDFRWNVTPRNAFYVSADVQSIDHDAPEPVFGEVRDEDLAQLSAGWNWQWGPKWIINIELNYYNNNSNIELFSYDRTELLAGVRFTFY